MFVLCVFIQSKTKENPDLSFCSLQSVISVYCTYLLEMASYMASLMTDFWFLRICQSSFNHKWHSFLPLQNISQNAKIIDSLLASLLGLSAESSSTSSVTVTWDPMQSLRNGDTVEYLLQAQCVGKDLDFRQVC